jgi:sulfide:quinone oxidoreductase
MPYDLFLGIPVHRVPEVVAASGLTVDGWIPVNPITLETSFADVFAVGDVTSVGTPKAGSFAERQATVVADNISARIRGVDPTAGFDGHGLCYLEFGRDQVATVEVTFVTGQTPEGHLEGPSPALMAEKAEFGTSRIRRWFGKDWPAN